MCVAVPIQSSANDVAAVKKKQPPPPSTLSSTVFEWVTGVGLVAAHVIFMGKAWEGEDKKDAFSRTTLTAPLVMTTLYFCMLFFGQKFMKKREPFGLRVHMIVYNLYQTLLNAWWCYAVVRQVNADYGGRWLESVAAAPDRTEKGFGLGFLIWIHYNNKMVEMLDTAFMVFRKKDRQISFLHVYHHVLILWAWFAVCRFGAGGASYFGGLCNSAIHVCMYSYYLMRLVNVPCPWKSHLTKAQLTQFCICMVHSFYNIYMGIYARWLAFFQLFVMVNMFVLFLDFYRQAYGKAKASKKKEMMSQKESLKAQ